MLQEALSHTVVGQLTLLQLYYNGACWAFGIYDAKFKIRECIKISEAYSQKQSVTQKNSLTETSKIGEEANQKRKYTLLQAQCHSFAQYRKENKRKNIKSREKILLGYKNPIFQCIIARSSILSKNDYLRSMC